jgi:hypothetical protein
MNTQCNIQICNPLGLRRSVEKPGTPQDAFRTECNQRQNIFSTEQCIPDGRQTVLGVTLSIHTKK